MENTGMTKNEFKKIIYESMENLLKNRKDLIGDAVLEALEDVGLAKAMEEGKTGEFAETTAFVKKLKTRAKKA